MSRPTEAVVQRWFGRYVDVALRELMDHRIHFMDVCPGPIVGLTSFIGFDLLGELFREFEPDDIPQ